MKILNSYIFDIVNNLLSKLQQVFSPVYQNSLILKNTDWFIFVAIVLVYVVSIFCSNNVTALFAIIVPVIVVIKTLFWGGKIELEKSNFFLILYFLICLISCFTSSMPVESLYGHSKTLLYFAFYLALCSFFKSSKNFILPIFFITGLLVLFESITGILQNSAGVLSIATWQDTSYINPENILTRVYGTLKPYNPNLFGGWLIAAIPTLIALGGIFFVKKKIIPAFISLLSLLISVLCLFYTGCRGAYIALFVMIAGVLAVVFKVNKIGKWVCGIFSAGFISFILLNQNIFQRLMSVFILRKDSSASFRMNVYNSAIEMFKDNPIFGIGAGNKVFREIYGLYMLSGFDALSCYCVFLEMAVESGIFALVLYIMFLYTLISGGIRKYIREKDTAVKILIFSCIISIVGVMVHGLVDTVYFRPQIQFIYWTMVAALTALTND